MHRASTASEAPRVVHSSFGRLRVHRPDPDGYVAAHLRELPGVTSAEANSLTENILILFNPRQISETAILAAFRTLRVEGPAEPVISTTYSVLTTQRDLPEADPTSKLS